MVESLQPELLMVLEPDSSNDHKALGEQPAPQQFSLLALLGVVAGFAMLFGILTWLGLNGMGALVAFAAAAGSALAAILCIEVFNRISKLRSRRD